VFEEREEREERVVGQGCHFGWLAKKKRRNKRRRRKGPFGRNSFEFRKIQIWSKRWWWFAKK
jgi:hypothetical protein